MDIHTKDDETCAHSRGHGSASDGLESEEHERGKKHSAQGREHAHGNVGDTGLDVVLANVLEIKATVESGEESGEGDEHLGQRRVDVHEELALQVFRSEAAEAVGGGCQQRMPIGRAGDTHWTSSKTTLLGW